MDRMLYIGMNGAAQGVNRQATISNNLANVDTPGFRAELDARRSVRVLGEARLDSRYAVVESTPGADFTSGPINVTGRHLDVAMMGDSWLSVISSQGDEAYTRRGDLQLNNQGQLVTGTGHLVIGENGPIEIPPGSKLFIAEDGTLSSRGENDGPENIIRLGRLKMVSPEAGQIEKGVDGLFRPATGLNPILPASETARLASGALEGSNVNPATAMVSMIEAQRMFEMQMKVITTADENAQRANGLLSIR